MINRGWTSVTLGDIAENISVRVDDPSKSGLDRFVGLVHLDSGSVTVSKWDSTESVTSSMKRFQAGDVLLARRNAHLRRASAVDFEGVCSGDAYVLREKPDAIVPGLLKYILNTNRFWEYAIANADGSMSTRVKWRHIESYQLMIPSHSIQMKNVELLESATICIGRSKAVSNSFSLVLSSIKSLSFTKIKGSEITYYCEADGIKIGPFGSLLHASDYVEHGIPVVNPTDIVKNKISMEKIKYVSTEKASELSAYRLSTNDIIIPRRGDLTKCALISESQNGWLCGTGSIRIRAKSGYEELLFHALTTPQISRWIQANAVGSTMPNLNVKIVSKIPVSLPTSKGDNEMLKGLLSRISEGITSFDTRATIATEVSKIITQKLIGRGF